MTATLDLVLVNDPDEVARLQAAFESFCEQADLPARITLQVMLALEELVVNIIRYGFPEGGLHQIAVRLALSDRDLICDLRDDGIAFDPFHEAPAPDLVQPIEDRRIGGLGIHLVKRTMDDLSYRREGGFNHTRIIKRLPSGG